MTRPIRAPQVMHQALLLLCILIVIAAVNTSTSPERFLALVLIEFLSMCVLSLTITLSLYFVDETADEQLADATAVRKRTKIERDLYGNELRFTFVRLRVLVLTT